MGRAFGVICKCGARLEVHDEFTASLPRVRSMDLEEDPDGHEVLSD